MTPLSYDKALSKAASLCSKSEKAPKEIYDKLATWGVTSQMAEKIVSYLIEEHFIDENRFARAFVHDKFLYEHWGRVKIAFALRCKGIPDAIVDNSLRDVISEEDYIIALMDLLKAKMRGMSLPLSQNDRARLYRFAAQRGYESSFISKAMHRIGDNDDDATWGT